jgi:uncharacterized OB-fold protein
MLCIMYIIHNNGLLLTDLGDRQVEIGMPVEMVTCKIRLGSDECGMQVYGYKFRPAGLGAPKQSI